MPHSPFPRAKHTRIIVTHHGGRMHSRAERDLKTLGDAFPRDRYHKKDILALLRKLHPRGFIVETKCTVQLDGLRFEFDGEGRLVGINTGAESSPEYECRA